ncbi:MULTISPECIES: AraC family transcriptional regulator [Ferrimonas]|uniref:AraC family transcriptional regulator n=1 Tax=Ferrimonas TaxID=44011 RepID=UPI0004202D16|nr:MULTISPECIES: helix-turn-helix transcriptional regulator [Ferrimonas]USD38716.1 helix-turn-helix domain-containing protein [Ferrimonas sp. SCSIO 43195]
MADAEIKSVSSEFGPKPINFSIYKVRNFLETWERDAFRLPHRIQFNALVYITEGEGEHFIDYKLYKLQPGTLLCLSKYQVHYFELNEHIDGYLITFDDDLFGNGVNDGYEQELVNAYSQVSCIEHCDPSVDALFEELFREYSLPVPEFEAEIVRGLLRIVLLKTVVRHQRQAANRSDSLSADAAFRQFIELIETRFKISRSVGDYAQRMGKSVKQLNKVAKDNAGLSAKQMLDSRTLLELKRLLAYSDLSICTIATNTGFVEATNMTKFFRHHTNMTPSEFRSMSRHAVAIPK